MGRCYGPGDVTIKEKAIAENISVKEAADNLANEIKLYRELTTLERKIKRTKEVLAYKPTSNN